MSSPSSMAVGVPQRHLPVLTALELARAVGLLAGLWLEPLGVARDRPRNLLRQRAGGHVRVGDTKNLAMPMPPLVRAVAVLVLRLLTL
jgi:hypothetical protein